MKKASTICHSAFLCLAALSAAACTGFLDTAEGYSTSLGNAIEVNAMIGGTAEAMTRAVTSSEVTTATLTKFWMWGYNDTTAIRGTLPIQNGDPITIRLSNREFTDAAVKGTFTDDVTYYWPNAQVKFIAVSSTEGTDPADTLRENRKLVVSSTGLTAEDFTIEKSLKLTDFTNQEDYIVAVNKTAKPAASNKISLTFQHMLSRVSINAYAPEFTTKHPSLACFGFDGVQKTGTFTYTGDLTDKPFDCTCWSAAQEDQKGLVGSIYTPADSSYNTSDYYWYTTDAFQVTATEVPAAANRLAYSSYTAPWLNVIPGESCATKLHITLWYEGSAWPFEIDLTSINDELEEYKPGYQYIYNVKIKGTSVSEGEKIRPEVEIYSVTVSEWNSEAATETIEAPDVAAGNTLAKQIAAAQEAGSQNLEISLTTEIVSEVTISSQIAVTTNVVIDLNGHGLKPAAVDAENAAVAAFKVSEGHRLAIKGTGTVNVSNFSNLFELASEENDSFAIRGGTWTIDPKQYVPGYVSSQDYTLLEGSTSYQITCSSDSWSYTISRSGSDTEDDPYTYTVYENAKQ